MREVVVSRVFWQKLSSWTWRSPSVTASIFATSAMTARAFSKRKACTQTSKLTRNPVSYMLTAKTPARSDNKGFALTALSNAARAFSRLRERPGK